MAVDFKPNQSDYKNLTPFKSWLLLQINTWGQNNFPFVESDFDELTNYGMMQKLMKAVNDVISNENLVEEDMTNLFNAYTELQNYVNNYFDNLDVQEEINNKLDEMAEDGSLTSLISNYVDPYIEEQNIRITNIDTSVNNRINEQNANINAQISTLNTKVNNATSGAPLMASSTSGMTDTTRAYVNTSDGNWYYYNGTTWVVGGVYQATEIPEFSIGNEKLKPKELTIENNSYYRDLIHLATSVISNKKLIGYEQSTYLPRYGDDTNFDCYIFNTSDIISAIGEYTSLYSYDKTKDYQTLILYTENTKGSNTYVGWLDGQGRNGFINYSRLSQYDNLALCLPKADKMFLSQYKYFRSNDGVYDISVNSEIKNQNIKNKINGSNVDLLLTDLTKQDGVTILPNCRPTGYDDTTETITTEYISNYTTIMIDKDVFTDYAKLRKIKFVVDSRIVNDFYVIYGYNTESHAHFGFPKSYLLTGNINNFYDNSTGIYNWGEFISTNLYYMNTFNKFAICFYSDNIVFYTDEITHANTNSDLLPITCSVNIFNSIGAIGDSYTAASVEHSDGTTWTDQTEQSYVATIAKRAGINYNNYGVGGASTRSYLTSPYGMQRVLNTNANDFYFLALGINDAYSLGTQYLGTISDIKSDYTQNADTFYGNYGKIISQVISHAPKAKLCMILIPIKGDIYTPFNAAIKEIAAHFEIPYIDPFDDRFFNSQLYNTKLAGHPTCLGYVGMGLAYERLLSVCINENINYFLYSNVG